MVSSCPGCGAAVEFAPRSVLAVHGTCGACGGTFTIVQPEAVVGQPTPTPQSGELGGAPGRAREGGGTAPQTTALPGPPCRNCGTALALRRWTRDTAEAVCPSCGESVAYRTGYPSRGPPREGFGGRDRARPFPAPRGRPCRECGGPLTFSTDAAGVVTGTCAKCGNRFTLPPRSRDRREGPGGRPERFSRGFPSRYRRVPDRSEEDEERSDRRRGRPRRTFRRRPGAKRDE